MNPSKSYTYPFPMASVTADLVVFGLDPTDRELKILLIERGREGEPFYGSWALPGGFLDVLTDPTLESCALRELKEETGLEDVYFEQLATFGDVGRDPRGRTVTVAYMALVRPEAVRVTAGDDARQAKWYNVADLDLNHSGRSINGVPLAFDHHKIITTGLARLRSKVRWQPVGIELLPETFTLSDLQRVYEAILGHELDKRGFRRKVARFDFIRPTGLKAKVGPGGRGPGGLLYRFDRKRYEKLRAEGLDFEV